MNVYSHAKENQEQMIRIPVLYKPVGIIRLQMIREGRTLYGMERFCNAKDAVNTVSPLFRMCDRETVAVMSVDARCAPLAVEVAAVGGLDACMIDPRIIYKHALLNNAASIICFHNHPSGNPEPSQEDRTVTKQLQEAGKILGVRLLDHIIIGEDTYYSFREQDLLDKPYHDCA